MQSELPLWSSGLESLGYSDPFPSKTNSTSPEDKMEDDSDSLAKSQSDNHESEEEKGWILYIGAICNRRTVNDMLIDMWRCGEKEWISNVAGVVQRTAEAVKVVDYWYFEAPNPHISRLPNYIPPRYSPRHISLDITPPY